MAGVYLRVTEAVRAIKYTRAITGRHSRGNGSHAGEHVGDRGWVQMRSAGTNASTSYGVGGRSVWRPALRREPRPRQPRLHQLRKTEPARSTGGRKSQAAAPPTPRRRRQRSATGSTSWPKVWAESHATASPDPLRQLGGRNGDFGDGLMPDASGGSLDRRAIGNGPSRRNAYSSLACCGAVA